MLSARMPLKSAITCSIRANPWTQCYMPCGWRNNNSPATPQHVVRYLGRYTHRVAISNHRLVSFADGEVTRSVPLCFAPEWIFFSSLSTFRTHTARCRALPHSLGTTPRRSFPRLNLHNDRVRRNRGQLPSSRCIESARTHRAPTCAVPLRASDTTLGLLARTESPDRPYRNPCATAYCKYEALGSLSSSRVAS
jgi:Putative transposase